MIQRIQSVYLLLTTVCLVLALCLPVGGFMGNDLLMISSFTPLGVKASGELIQSTWGLFAILLLAAVIAFCNIFLYRNRMLQIRMTVFCTLLLIGYYITLGVFVYTLKDTLGAASFKVGWAMCLPAVCIILNYLAFRGIYRDELMVKAADRLR